GRASITTADGTVRRAALSGGVLSVKGGVVSVAATTFEYAEDIDRRRAERAKERAEEALKSAEDERALRLAKAKLERALLRMNIADER
ncbi:MAG TPA: F0F1 ATP synthase subunit epsilon, partial [Clostridiales bacterium]|nr:F0F1 ATP synthase subunit epsilon [Clostridiales bacterium]